MKEKSIYQEMADRWPSTVVARSEIGRFTGYMISPRTMANLDSLKQGPGTRIMVGAKVGYPVAEFVVWLESRGGRK